ncbi:MAG TPA: ATP-dependent DNA helicase RecG [Solirubrobacteraceae bacterium]|jgi:ATP-dependent DNA helicase RecG|nr:ATP-dependent DNA helicase RecG [Solirubrobacteraceae bacterium]
MSQLAQANVREASDRDAGQRAFASEESPTREEWLAAPVRWPKPSRLEEDLQAALDVRLGKMADGLEALGLRSVGALLEHLPRDSREARTVNGLRPGEAATVAVQVRTIAARPVRRRGMKPLVQASVFDETGTMRATFFNQPWLAQRYKPGTRLVLHGKTTARGTFNVAHHAVGSDLGAEFGAGAPGEIVAHYPAAEGVSSTQILTLVRGARAALADVPEALSAAARVSERLPDRASALAAMHFGRSPQERESGRERLAFEELLLNQLVFLGRRARRRAGSGAPALDRAPSLSERWLAEQLTFELTGDQRRAIATIGEDLAQERAMQRLLLGEVGSGKTVVAVWALLRAVEHGMQAALMAPTETLAEQHFATLQQLLGGEQANVTCALLTGSTTARRRADTLGKLAGGELSLIVGTHALIEPDVEFRALAVAVVDEQHRFGVRQRAALDGKVGAGPSGDLRVPHVLHMTATPIPRTLALATYGDLDTTMLRELPRGRQPIDTRIVSGESERERSYEQLREQLRAGRQAYVVCPLIEQAGDAGEGAGSVAGVDGDVRDATAELERLRRGELKDHRLVLLHGGMRPREKAEAMAQFASGAAAVLVATTVIEVGIDVPNASVILIENAERFGISQLHQLRGRVGRGEHRSSCLLMGPAGAARLRALQQHADGFELAEIDLRLRNEGELIGVRQSGIGRHQIACLPEDADLLERARTCAEAIVAADPQLRAPEHELLADALERAFGADALEPIPA